VTSTDGAQGTVNGGARSARKRAYLEFKAAVLEFSDDPTPATMVRYLSASGALDGLDALPRRPTASVNSNGRPKVLARSE
jgi:hypothetical protein